MTEEVQTTRKGKKHRPHKRAFQIYCGEDGLWYWRLIAGNGFVIATGGEGYASKWHVKRAHSVVIKALDEAEIEVVS